MSTKTTFKRIALVTVAALSFGLLTSVTPASAVASTALNAVVGPNGATSLTVVGGTDSTTGALIRLDVTSDSATTTDIGLQEGETITASVIGVPTSVTAKTLAANGGAVSDTATAPGSGKSDFTMVEVKGQSQGTVGSATTTTSGYTDWTKHSTRDAYLTNAETYTLHSAISHPYDGQLGGYGAAGTVSNSYFTNMDGRAELTAGNNTVSYYVSVHPRLVRQ